MHVVAKATLLACCSLLAESTPASGMGFLSKVSPSGVQDAEYVYIHVHCTWRLLCP